MCSVFPNRTFDSILKWDSNDNETFEFTHSFDSEKTMKEEREKKHVKNRMKLEKFIIFSSVIVTPMNRSME